MANVVTTVPRAPKTWKFQIGNFYSRDVSGDIYFVCHTGNGAKLVNLADGGWWSDGDLSKLNTEGWTPVTTTITIQPKE